MNEASGFVSPALCRAAGQQKCAAGLLLPAWFAVVEKR
jgi:hypothetical protein